MTAIILKSSEVYLQEKKIESLGVSLSDLMEKAGKAVFDIILERFPSQKTLILVGPGNNGGDGYVVALLLEKAGWEVDVASFNNKPPTSLLALEKYQKWAGTFKNISDIHFDDYSLIIDAIFGIGLSKSVEDPLLNYINKINQSNVTIVSIDIPTGISADNGTILSAAIHANLTITFNFLKPGHVLLPSSIQCGEIIIVDIGIPTPYPILWQQNDPDVWRQMIPRPNALSHKYKRGHLGLIGSKEMTGATRLASIAARRMGVGLLSIICPLHAEIIYALSDPGHLIKPYDSMEDFDSLLDLHQFSAFSIGSGLLPNTETQALVSKILTLKKPTLIDAGALMAFEKNPSILFNQLHDTCVLTPHEGEFKRLFNDKVDFNISKIEQTIQAAQISGCVILYKGGDTIIAKPIGEIIVENQYAPYLASAGTGDVLAGLIAGLLAQGIDSFWAASISIYVQRKAAMMLGPGLIAEDLSYKIPAVLRELIE
ncbi:MAG: NAD(P)H-hydrate dehydratase [Alphaproteobacteria bacterium]|nr:NAD(P)H-hydrate dehydratase [Alphaproteobacteria bacterium]